MLQATKHNETANSPVRNMAELGVHLLYIYGSPFSAADISNNKWVAHRVASKMKYQKNSESKYLGESHAGIFPCRKSGRGSMSPL